MPGSPRRSRPTFDAALVVARTPHRGPTFLDVPLDGWSAIAAAVPAPPSAAALAGDEPDADAVSRVAALVAESRRPVLLVGGDVYWAGAEVELRAFVEAAVVPAFANDMGRGMLPADHGSRSRAPAPRRSSGADLVIVAGTPLDFRLGFGRFGTAAVVHLADTAGGVATGVDLAASAAGDLEGDVRDARRRGGAHGRRPRAASGASEWIGSRGCATRSAPVASRRSPGSPRTPTPIVPTRVYGELRARLERDAIVIGDGGDFVSYAGKYVDTFVPGDVPRPGSVRVPGARSRVRPGRRARAAVDARSSRCSATARSASHSATSTRWRDTART